MPSTEFKLQIDPVTGRRIAVFRKYLPSGTSPIFQAEARGLAAIAATGTVATPAVIQSSEREIVTALIYQGQPRHDAWALLGEQIGSLHRLPQTSFGFDIDTFCGANRQPNPLTENGHRFFTCHRLQFQADMASEAGWLSTSERADVDALCARISALIPEQAPALLHGDLWRGNVLFDEAGSPFVIDPACYWGWPEADIAMCDLFGGFASEFFERWASVYQPLSGWRERLPLYQLYHLLNHLNLFGRSYHADVLAVLRRFR